MRLAASRRTTALSISIAEATADLYPFARVCVDDVDMS